MISITEAARGLLESVHAPKGAVSVLALQDAEGPHLVVWIDSTYTPRLAPIPDMYEGYPVRVELRPKAVAYRH